MPKENNTIYKSLVVSFCKAWNRLDSRYIENSFTKDFVYSSQMVLTDLNGKEAYLSYIKAKFYALRNGDNRVTAELGYYENEPCFVLTQTLSNPLGAPFGNPDYISESPNQPLVKEVVATVLIKFENELIKSAIMCVIPGIRSIKRTGFFPK